MGFNIPSSAMDVALQVCAKTVRKLCETFRLGVCGSLTSRVLTIIMTCERFWDCNIVCWRCVLGG